MKRFDNPLDNIRIASPCSADWNEMYGDDRKRFCADCKLNVYNLSDMTRQEAENLLFQSEGRLCVRFFRRADGTILTTNCPLGWRALKRRASRIVTAVSASVIGLIGGLFAIRGAEAMISIVPIRDVPAPSLEWTSNEDFEFQGRPIVGVPEITELEGQVELSEFRLSREGKGPVRFRAISRQNTSK